MKSLVRRIDDPDSNLPPLVVEFTRPHLDQLQACSERIAVIERRLRDAARSDPEAARLQTAPGVGPVSAPAIKAFAPPMEGFKRGRDFAAWLGLIPVQRSTGERQILGRTSKMGQRDIRRLLIIGAMTRNRWAIKNGLPKGRRAGTDAGTQAAHAGGDRAGQQDRRGDLGDDEPAPAFPEAGCFESCAAMARVSSSA